MTELERDDVAATGETADDDTAGPPSVPRSRFVLAAVAAVAFALVALLLAVVAAGLQSELDQERGERTDVARVAGEFSAALLTYEHGELDEARERVLALSTGRFRREYDEAFAGLEELIQAAESRSQATVKDVFVGDVSDGSARVITVVDADVEGTAGRRRSLDSYILLDLVKVEGDWRVDGVTSLNFTADGSGEAPPAPPEQPEE